MKIALLGDTHFGARGDSQAFHKYFFKFYDEVFFPYLKDNNITEVIQLGDLMDRRKFVNYVTLSDMREKFINKFVGDLNLHVLLGNHDVYYRNTNRVNSLTELFGNLKEHYNITIIDENSTLDFGGLAIDIIPWINKENYADSMEFIKKSLSTTCIGHFEIKGFEMHKGMKAGGGLGINTFKGYDYVYSGHFHTRSSNKNVTYVGTPYELTWSDYDDIRGFHILDTENGMIEFIKNPSKMHHKVFYDDTIEDYSKHDVKKYHGSIVKVIIVNKTDVRKFENFIERLSNIDLINFNIVDVSLDYSDDAIDNIETEDTLTILFNSIDNLDEDTRMDKSLMKDYVKEIYNEALEQAQEK